MPKWCGISELPITNCHAGCNFDSQFLSQIQAASNYKCWGFYGDRIQRNVVGQTAASGCEVFPMFHGLTLSASSACSGGLAGPRQVNKWHHKKCPKKMKFESAPSEGQSRATVFQDEKGYSCGLAALGNISEPSLHYWNKKISECYLCQVCPTRKISELVPP